MFPTWFKPEAGFKYIDGDGDLVVVLGDGKWRDDEPIGSVSLSCDDGRIINKTVYDLKFMGRGVIAAYFYKGEWHLTDVSDVGRGYDETYWAKAKPA